MPRPKYHCPYCTERFYTATKLGQHINHVHRIEKEDKEMGDFKTFQNAQVGDKLFSSIEGPCVVTSIRYHPLYPIKVKYVNHNGYDTFTLEGKLTDSHYLPTLFWTEPQISVPGSTYLYNLSTTPKYQRVLTPENRRKAPKSELVTVTGEDGRTIELSRKSAEELGLA